MNDSTLVIAFRVKGQGVLFQEICEPYYEGEKVKDESIIPCEYLEDKIELPLIVLLKYDTTNSLNQEQIESLNIVEYQQESFNIMWCE